MACPRVCYTPRLAHDRHNAHGCRCAFGSVFGLASLHVLGVLAYRAGAGEYIRVTLNPWQLAEHVAELAASAQFNDITTRVAHWLVLSAERAQTHRLIITHEHLARMLGVRRVSVTLAAGEMKERGVIRYQRGILEILDMPQLSRLARPEL